MKTLTTQSLVIAAVVAFAASGCATKKPVQTFRPTAKQVVVQVIPEQGRPAPRVSPVPDNPLPVYQNPIIEEVEAAPYVDEQGNLVFPQKIMVIREPGHWNLDAAKRNAQYYVPANNMPPQLAPPSKSFYDYIQTKKTGVIQPASLDVSKITVTGYLQKEDEAAARASLKDGETLSYDPYLGWLAVPTTLLQKGASLPVPATAPVTQPTQPAPQAEATLPPPHPVGSADPTPSGSREDEVKKLIEDAFKQGVNN